MSGLEERGQALNWVLDKLAAAAKKKAAPGLSAFKSPKFEPMKPFKAFKPPEKITTDRKKKEVDLWHTWNDNGRKPKDLDPLLKTFNNMVQKRVNLFRRAEVPTSAVEHEHKKCLVEALKTWDHKKGGALNTWIDIKLQRGGRFVEANKNAAYIPENISQHIGAYNALKADIHEKLGHEPDANTIHEHVLEFGHPKVSFAALSLKDIKRLEKEQRRGLIATGNDSKELGGTPHASSRAEEIKLLIFPELTKEELIVHEYSFGLNGKPQLKPGAIAKKTKMDGSKVAKLRTSIIGKMRKYLGDEDGE